MRHSILKIILTVLFVPLLSQASFAQETLNVGDTLPQTMSLKNHEGVDNNINALAGKNGTILLFYRSADWCPYCKAQLIDIRNNHEKFTTEGFSVVGISYDSLEALQKFQNKYNPEFTLLSDPNSKTIKTFGIFDESQREGSFAYGVAKPTVFVVNRHQKITAVLAEESFKKRPQIETIIEAVKQANTK